MKIDVKFSEQTASFDPNFGEVHNISDGGFERGYAAGYDAGFAEGADNSVIDALVSRTITTYSNDRVTTIGQSAFYFCTALRSASFKNAKVADNYAFRYCMKLEKVDFPSVTKIGTGVFEYSYALDTLILRADMVCELGSTTSFNNCYHFLGTVNASYNPQGLKDGFIYVPKNLVGQYKAAKNWSTYASQIRAIEDYPEITG